MNRELLKHLKDSDKETKEKLRNWLNDGHGHSSCPPEWFIERGVPEDLALEKVSRQWSNFVFVPEACSKVALCAAQSLPIGYFDTGHKYSTGWRHLITPQTTEAGYLDPYTNIRENDKTWVSNDDWESFFKTLPDEVQDANAEFSKLSKGIYPWADNYDEFINNCIEMGEIVKDNHIGIKHYHSRVECVWEEQDELYLKMVMDINVEPSMNYDNEPIIYEREGFYPLLTKTEGHRRVDYIDVHKVWNQHIHEKSKGMKMEEIEKEVDKNIKEYKENENLIGRIGGRNIVTADEWRNLSRDELIQKHVEDRQNELDFYAKIEEKLHKKAPFVVKYVYQLLSEKGHEDPIAEAMFTDAPEGWALEYAQPLGYMDCMWNGNYFVPWVDGTGSTSMLTHLCNEFEVDSNPVSMGRGSSAREIGSDLLKFLKEKGVWEEEE